MSSRFRQIVAVVALASYTLANNAAWHHVCHDCAHHTQQSFALHLVGTAGDIPTSRFDGDSDRNSARAAMERSHQSDSRQHKSEHDRSNCLLCRFSVQRSPTLHIDLTPAHVSCVRQVVAARPIQALVCAIFVPDSRAPPAVFNS